MLDMLIKVSYELPRGGGDLSKYLVDNIFIVSQKRIGFSGSILFVV